MEQLISVNIRPHLIPFLFQELEGESKAVYESKKVKLARVTKRSPLGKLLYVFKSRAVSKKASDKVLGYSVFLAMDQENTQETKALINERNYQSHKELELLQEDVKLLNDLLESIFRISFIQFVQGYIKNRKSKDFVNSAIHEFMLQHNLYDTEIDPDVTLRSLYYKSIKKNKTLHRIQVPISNQVKDYCLAQ